MAPAPVELTPAQITRTARGTLLVEVNGAPVCEAPDLAAGVHELCELAMRTGLHLVVTVISRAGRQHMTVDPTGHVSAAAAPAPRLTAQVRSIAAPGPQPVPQAGRSTNLAEGRDDQLASQEWVEKFILDPAAGAGAAGDTQAAADASARRGVLGALRRRTSPRARA